jgi:polo-like kinase 4
LTLQIDKSLLRRQKDLTERVRNEVEIHTQLKHPNILELLDFFEDDKNVYIVSELCKKGELYSFMKKHLRRPLTENEASKIFSQIAHGLAFLHDSGIIHRDLKCSNILIKEDLTVVSSTLYLETNTKSYAYE